MEDIFEGIMANNFPKLMKYKKPYILEVQRTSSRINYYTHTHTPLDISKSNCWKPKSQRYKENLEGRQRKRRNVTYRKKENLANFLEEIT